MLQVVRDDGQAGPVLSVRDVSYAFASRRALDHVSFDLMPGRFTALLGANGAGKTTLFSLITRLFDTANGRIEIGGLDLRTHGSGALAPLGVVFQQPTLDLDLTVRQNLAYFAALRGLPRREARDRMMDALGALAMSERIGERVRSLNGGHRRRVEIARALLHGPRLLLLDEPTVGLDVPTRKALVAHAHDLAARDGVAVLWATHLVDEIGPDDDLILLHRGRIRAKGRAEDVIKAQGATDLSELFTTLAGDEGEPAS
jgi:ABC-2 type transport system ATP-binding protein